jgi:hypothetical protein
VRLVHILSIVTVVYIVSTCTSSRERCRRSRGCWAAFRRCLRRSESYLLQWRLAGVNGGILLGIDESHLLQLSHAWYYVHHGCCDVCAVVVAELIESQQFEITSANVSWHMVIEGWQRFAAKEQRYREKTLDFIATPTEVRSPICPRSFQNPSSQTTHIQGHEIPESIQLQPGIYLP